MFRSGYVAILGVPNVGKSTLLNSFLGEKLAIVTPKPQTTRHRILGIVNRPQAQILFLDTPGIHAADRPLNVAMVQTALKTLGDADVVLHLVFPKPGLAEEDVEIAHKIQEVRKPHLILINRIDEVSKTSLLSLMQNLKENFNPNEIIPVSALLGDGVDRALTAVEKYLPEGPAYYPTDVYTEHDLRFLAAEIVREKAMNLLHREIPYHLATQVEEFKEEEKIDRIAIVIFVERASQKGIVIGAKGAMLKKIGQLAREDIEKMVGKKVYLELFVKVQEDWTKDKAKLRELGILHG